MKKVHSFQGLLTASCLVLLALEINRPASGATVTATVVTIGVDNKTTGPIGIPGPTFGRAYALLTPGIIPIPIPFNDPAGASTGTFRAITPATPAVAGAPALGLGSEASVSFPAAGTKVLNADAFIIGVSPFAGAQAKDPIQYGPLSYDTSVTESIQLNSLQVLSDPTHSADLHLDYSLGNSPTNLSTLFALDIIASSGGSPIATFSNISSVLTNQNPAWNATNLSSTLTGDLSGGANINFSLPSFHFSLPANSTEYLANNFEVDASVPEPSSLVIMGTGGASLMLASWLWRAFRGRRVGV